MGTVKLIAGLDNESKRRLLWFRRGVERAERRDARRDMKPLVTEAI